MEVRAEIAAALSLVNDPDNLPRHAGGLGNLFIAASGLIDRADRGIESGRIGDDARFPEGFEVRIHGFCSP